VESQDYEISAEPTRINLRTISPDWAADFGGHGTHRYANDIDIQYFGTGETMAEVIPPGPKGLIRAIGGVGFNDWRFGRNGLTHLAQSKRSIVWLTLPPAEDLFREWLTVRGWTANISPTGRIAKQMLKQFGGIWGIHILANRRLIDLLERMSHGRTLGREEFWGEIQRIAQAERFRPDPIVTLDSLVKAHVFQLGIHIQCPICVQRSWYSLTDADYELRCPRCLEAFHVPEHSPRDLRWAYRTIGPFSLESRSYGVYAVLLTLRFFARLMDVRHTTMLSFEARKEKRSLEADLGMLLRENAWWRPNVRLLFCECKTFNRFEENDVKRMRDIGQEFPGAVLVFATLNESLSNGEKRMLRKIAIWGRRRAGLGTHGNPVLVLTGNELFGDTGPEQGWKEMSGRHAQMGAWVGWAPGVLKLCDATQQLYLDMPPWFEWFEARMRRRRGRVVRAAPPAPEPGQVPSSPTGKGGVVSPIPV
jgi:hypothetical protein